MNSEMFNVMDMKKRDLEKLSKAEFIKMVEKLRNKAKKSKIAIVDVPRRNHDNAQVSQPKPRKTPKHIRPRDPKTERFFMIHPDRPKQPKQPAKIKGRKRAIRI